MPDPRHDQDPPERLGQLESRVDDLRTELRPSPTDPHLFSRLDSIDNQLGEVRRDIGHLRGSVEGLNAKVVGISATTALLISAVGFMAFQVLA